MNRYTDELFTLKSNVYLVKRGDLRWPKSHRVTEKCFVQNYYASLTPSECEFCLWSLTSLNVKSWIENNGTHLLVMLLSCSLSLGVNEPLGNTVVLEEGSIFEPKDICSTMRNWILDSRVIGTYVVRMY